MAIKIEFDAETFRQSSQQLTHVEMPAACRRALRQMSGEVLNRLKGVLTDNIDNPTQFTLNAPYTSLLPNSKPASEIGLKPIQSEYLRYLFDGGTHDRKLVPTDNTPLDAHGNIPRGYVALQLAAGAFWMTSNSGVLTLFEHGPDGSLEALAMVVDEVDYDKRVDFEEEVSLILADLLPDAVARAMRGGQA